MLRFLTTRASLLAVAGLSLVTRRGSILAVAGLTLVMSACGSAAVDQLMGPASAPTLAPASAPTAAPTGLPTTAATGLPTATRSQPTDQSAIQAAPTAQPNQPRAATPAQPNQAISPATAQPAAQAQPPTGASTTLVIDSSATRASYRAHEQLVGRTLPSEAVGTSSSVSGSLVLAPDGSIVADQSRISVDLSKLQSDESRRDNFIKGTTLQTSRFPMATFVPRGAQGLPSPLPTSGRLSFQLLGDLTVHGVTRPVTWQVTAQFGDATISGAATTTVKISDFGMTPPKAGPVLSIEDGLTLELAFTAAREA